MSSIFSLFLGISQAQVDPDAETMKAFKAEVDAAYRLEAERLRDRYDGFYQFLAEKERDNKERLAGSKDMKDQRARMIDAAEAARREHLQTRQPKLAPEDNPHLPAYEREIKERESDYEKKRELFVLKRTRLQDLRETSQKVPEPKDVGLE